jgi:hypothetical protein
LNSAVTAQKFKKQFLLSITIIKMKTTNYLVLIVGILLFSAVNSQAQIKIGGDPITINPSSVLEIESANKGVLFPRVALESTSDVATIASPVYGLTVFNTATDGTSPIDVTPGYYYWHGTKWVKLAVETAPIEFVKTVYVNAVSPNLDAATLFDETNPPATDVDALKKDVANLYIGSDGSAWTYDNANDTYKTYAVAPSTPFYLANTITDAGGNKTGNIWRAGNIGVGINNPATNLHIQNALAATNTVNADAKVLRFSRPSTASAKLDNIAQFNLGSYSITNANAFTRLDLALSNGNDNTTLSNVMTWQANGNVGIGTTAPSAPLVINGATARGSLKLIAPSVAAGDNWWMGFAHGPTSTDENDRARIGVDILGGGAGRLFFTTGSPNAQTRAMFIDESQRVGIGTNAPASRLEVNGSSTNTTSFNAVNSATIDFSKSNLAYTGASPGAFTLTNIKDGGTYTLSVRGVNTSGAISTFNVPSGFFVKGPNHNSPTTANSETLYTFLVIGTYVYVYMATGI